MLRETKQLPVTDLLALQSSLNLHPQYQRQADLWTLGRRQNLIHSVLADFDIPKVYIRLVNDSQTFEMVDGLQRYQTLRMFRDNALRTDGQIKEIAGMKYSDLPHEWRDKFDQYKFDVSILMCDESQARQLFRKHGEQVPLTEQEKRNAAEGPVRDAVASLARHRLFDFVCFSDRRFGYQLSVAQVFTLLAHDQISGVRKANINKAYSLSSARADEVACKVQNSFDYLLRAFQDHQGRCKSLSRLAVIDASLLVDRFLLPHQVPEEKFYEGWVDFHGRECDSRVAWRQLRDQGELASNIERRQQILRAWFSPLTANDGPARPVKSVFAPS